MMLVLQKMNIVGGDQIEVQLAGDPHKLGIAAPLGFQAMIVQLDEKIFPPKNLAILARDAPRTGRIAREQAAVDLSLDAAAQCDETARMDCQQVLVDTWFVVEAFEMRRTDKFYKVAIARDICCKKRQMESSFLPGSRMTITQ